MKNAFCPSCGAPVKFRWSSAVQTIAILPLDPCAARCESGGGRRSRGPPDRSRRSRSERKASIGISHSLSSGGFLRIRAGRVERMASDVQRRRQRLAVGRAARVRRLISTGRCRQLPPAHDLPRGWTQHVDNIKLEVTSITRAHYAGVEGELPFEYWGKQMSFLPTCDRPMRILRRSTTARILRCSSSGEAVEFEDLQFKNLKRIEGWS